MVLVGCAVSTSYYSFVLEVQPKDAPAEVVRKIKSFSVRIMFREFPEIKKIVCLGELWNDGSFVRSVGDKVTAEVVKNNVRYQHNEQMGFTFQGAPQRCRGVLHFNLLSKTMQF